MYYVDNYPVLDALIKGTSTAVTFRDLLACYERKELHGYMAIRGLGSAEFPLRVIVQMRHQEESIKDLSIKDGLTTAVFVLSSEISWKIFDGLHVRGL